MSCVDDVGRIVLADLEPAVWAGAHGGSENQQCAAVHCQARIRSEIAESNDSSCHLRPPKTCATDCEIFRVLVEIRSRWLQLWCCLVLRQFSFHGPPRVLCVSMFHIVELDTQGCTCSDGSTDVLFWEPPCSLICHYTCIAAQLDTSLPNRSLIVLFFSDMHPCHPSPCKENYVNIASGTHGSGKSSLFALNALLQEFCGVWSFIPFSSAASCLCRMGVAMRTADTWIHCSSKKEEKSVSGKGRFTYCCVWFYFTYGPCLSLVSSALLPAPFRNKILAPGARLLIPFVNLWKLYKMCTGGDTCSCSAMLLEEVWEELLMNTWPLHCSNSCSITRLSVTFISRWFSDGDTSMSSLRHLQNAAWKRADSVAHRLVTSVLVLATGWTFRCD